MTRSVIGLCLYGVIKRLLSRIHQQALFYPPPLLGYLYQGQLQQANVSTGTSCRYWTKPRSTANVKALAPAGELD